MRWTSNSSLWSSQAAILKIISYNTISVFVLRGRALGFWHETRNESLPFVAYLFKFSAKLILTILFCIESDPLNTPDTSTIKLEESVSSLLSNFSIVPSITTGKEVSERALKRGVYHRYNDNPSLFSYSIRELKILYFRRYTLLKSRKFQKFALIKFRVNFHGLLIWRSLKQWHLLRQCYYFDPNFWDLSFKLWQFKSHQW